MEPGVNEPAEAVVMGDATGGPKGDEAAFLIRQPVTHPAPGSDDLTYEPPCPASRVEAFDAAGPHDSRWHTLRCVDCGASSTTAVVAAKRLKPGTPEYAEAWRLERSRIHRQLTTDDELLDPHQNPLHPRAEPDGPVFTGDGRGERQPWPAFASDIGRGAT